VPLQCPKRLAVWQKPYEKETCSYALVIVQKVLVKNETGIRNLFQNVNVMVHKNSSFPIVLLPEPWN